MLGNLLVFIKVKARLSSILHSLPQQFLFYTQIRLGFSLATIYSAGSSTFQVKFSCFR
jgi:hypothetical protein